MSDLGDTPETILARVQALVENEAPGAVCELQAYKTQIGCGALDERNTLHEIKWALKGINEWRVLDQARVLASRVVPCERVQRPR